MSAATDRRDTIDAPAPGAGLRGLLRRAMRERDLSLRVACPGTVVAYTPATQTATVTLGFLRVQSTNTPAGEVEVLLPPELVRARVAVVQGATHSDHVPIAPGDTGLLLFADRALDQWYQQGGAPVDPVDGRAHDQADAVFVPGLAPDARRSAPPTPALLAAQARVIDAPQIALGAAAVPGVDNVAIAQLLHTYLVGLVTAAVPVALDGGVSLKASMLTYLGANPAASFAASKVSAE